MVLLTLFSISLWLLIEGKEHSIDEHNKTLIKLQNDFKEIRHTNQYAVLYVPPPNTQAGKVYYVPRSPKIPKACSLVIFPEVNAKNRNYYPQNYAGSTVDFNGHMYREMLGRTHNYTIHTEDLCLNLVFPGLKKWYVENYSVKAIRSIYLFTHFLPCPRCFDIINKFIQSNQNVSLYVGYSQLYGGMRESNDSFKMQETEQRQKSLQKLLTENKGLLIQVTNAGVCQQQDIGGKKTRDITNICENTKEMIVIEMDFTTGKAQVWFHGFNSDYYGWVALVDGNNRILTWEYTNGQTTGKITFNAYIQNGAYVQYWPNYYTITRHSYPWKDCGFGFISLNKLPYTVNNPSNSAQIKLTMKDDYPTVLIKMSSYYTPNPYDWVMIQTLEQIGTDNYLTWNWLTYFKYESSYVYFQFTLGTKYADGFRAKYVFYDGTKYRYEGIYDNASQIWTPGGCQGGA